MDPFVIAPVDRGYEHLGVRVVPDAFPGGGVLGGIATGLHEIANEDDLLLVVACDHPFLSVELLAYMSEIDTS